MNFEKLFEDELFWIVVSFASIGVFALLILCWLAKPIEDKGYRRTDDQSGNVFFVLFGAVILLGGIGSVLTSIIGGPAQGVSQITRRTMSETDLAAAAQIIAATARNTVGDCDSDGMIEPLPWRAPGSTPAPAGGGLIPDGTAAVTADKWGRPVGFCSWDHGSASVADGVPECGGTSALRRAGGDVITEHVIALVSAGPDGAFSTTCRDFVDGNSDGEPDQPLVEKVPGSDDIVLAYTYGEAFAAGEGGTTGTIGEQPDEACTAQTAGLLRDEMGTIQVCASEGWKEVGAAVLGSGDFTPLTGREPNSWHTSNTISFSGFFGSRTASVDGGAVIVVNGDEKGPTAAIAPGDTVALRASAAAAPETERTITLTISALKRDWKITTRDKYPAVLTMTPSTAAAMNVSSPSSNPAYGSPVVFTVQNTGEADTAHMQAAVLSSTTNFQFYVGGGHLGDNCNGRTLAGGATCQIAVRPMATNDGSFSGTLSVSDGAVSDSSSLSGTASGWTCSLDGRSVAHGSSWTFYTASSVPCGSSCSGQPRNCTFGELSGSPSYNKANCSVAACAGIWVYNGNAASCGGYAGCPGVGGSACTLGVHTSCCEGWSHNIYNCAASASRSWAGIGMTWGSYCAPNNTSCPGKSVFDNDIAGYPSLGVPCSAPAAGTICGYNDPEVVNCLQVRCQ